MIVCELLLMDDVKELDEKIYQRIKDAVSFAVVNEQLSSDAELCIALSTDEQIRSLNKDFRGNDSSTDVLSFPANDLTQPLNISMKNGFEPEITESGTIFLGDIVISLDTAEKQSLEYRNTLTEELCFLAVHGVLHLLGYDHIDPDDEKIMREKQRLARTARLGV